MTKLEQIKNTLLNTDVQFYIRNRTQEEYHPNNIQNFSTRTFRIAYILDDIADLLVDESLSKFLSTMAKKMRKNSAISVEELELIKLALRKCYKKCINNRYEDVGKKYQIV